MLKLSKKKIFQDFISREGLRSTRQRDIILEFFLSSSRHMSIEEFYRKIRAKHPGIGYATVCRTLKLFARSGIAHDIHFGDGQTRYEQIAEGEHHDHLDCTKCGWRSRSPHSWPGGPIAPLRHLHSPISTGHKLDIYG